MSVGLAEIYWHAATAYGYCIVLCSAPKAQNITWVTSPALDRWRKIVHTLNNRIIFVYSVQDYVILITDTVQKPQKLTKLPTRLPKILTVIHHRRV